MGTPLFEDDSARDEYLGLFKELFDQVISQAINDPELTAVERLQNHDCFDWNAEFAERIRVYTPTPPPQDEIDLDEIIRRFKEFDRIHKTDDIEKIEEIPDEIPNEMVASQRTAALAEESAEVELLYAQAQKFSEINKKLAASQSRVINLGQSLKEALGPLYNDTQHLQTVAESKLST